MKKYSVYSGLVMLCAVGFFSAHAAYDTGSIRKRGRCIAVFNTSEKEVTLVFTVYAHEDESMASRAWGWLKGAVGKGPATIEKLITIKPGAVVSFNQKPKLSARAGATGEYRYVEGIKIDGPGITPADLDTAEVERVNRYIAKYLDDQSGCKENENTRKVVALVVIDKNNVPEQIETFLNENSKEEFLASFDNGYGLVVPFKQEKTLIDRLTLHAEQHPKSIGLVKDSLATTLVAIRAGLGDPTAAALLPAAVSKLANNSFNALKGSAALERIAKKLGGSADAVLKAKDLTDKLGLTDTLAKLVDAELDKVGGKIRNQTVRVAFDAIKGSKDDVAQLIVQGSELLKKGELDPDAAKKLANRIRAEVQGLLAEAQSGAAVKQELDQGELGSWAVIEHATSQLASAGLDAANALDPSGARKEAEQAGISTKKLDEDWVTILPIEEDEVRAQPIDQNEQVGAGLPTGATPR